MQMQRLALAAAAAVIYTVGLSTVARADVQKIDPVHSSAIFWVHHFSAGHVAGMIGGITGTINDDPDVAKMSFDVSIDVNTLQTLNAQRDKDLKGPQYLDAEHFPTMTFKSSAVKDAGDKKLEVTGDITIHGVTKPITVMIDRTGEGTGPKGETRFGYLTTFTVKRSDFGVNPTAPEKMIGDGVKITLSLEAIGQ